LVDNMQVTLRERIRKEIELLSKEGSDLWVSATNMRRDGNNAVVDLLTFGAAYQIWYTRAIRVVGALAPDRLKEFVAYYEIDPKRKVVTGTTYRIQDYLAGLTPAKDRVTGKVPYDHRGVTQVAFFSQLAILRAVETRLDDILNDLESRIAAEVQDAGLAAARDLLKINARAAGALAGVVLEDHLQRVARTQGVKVAKKDPTISDLNDPLKAAEVYDQSTWRKIQYLGDIRNLCSHKKSIEPTLNQVQELLDGTAWVVANIS
jgi:hypothetical protein